MPSLLPAERQIWNPSLLFQAEPPWLRRLKEGATGVSSPDSPPVLITLFLKKKTFLETKLAQRPVRRTWHLDSLHVRPLACSLL